MDRGLKGQRRRPYSVLLYGAAKGSSSLGPLLDKAPPCGNNNNSKGKSTACGSLGKFNPSQFLSVLQRYSPFVDGGAERGETAVPAVRRTDSRVALADGHGHCGRRAESQSALGGHRSTCRGATEPARDPQDGASYRRGHGYDGGRRPGLCAVDDEAAPIARSEADA